MLEVHCVVVTVCEVVEKELKTASIDSSTIAAV
jgi:hypothetical protein